MMMDDGKKNDDDLNEDIDADFDDFGDDDFVDDFDEEEKSNTLGSLWRNNPLVKVGLLLGGAAVLLFIVMSFGGGGDQQQDQSVVPGGADVTQAPGTAEVSPAMREAFEEVNQAEVERAQREGESALPIQIDPPSDALPIPQEEESQRDPLQEWRRLQQERMQQELETTETVDAVPAQQQQGPDPAITALADAMSQQMQSILEQQGGTTVRNLVITTDEFRDRVFGTPEANAQTGEAAPADGDEESPIIENVIMPAGEILYAQLITEANSDVPGPVMAIIHSGPLKGSRVLGQFEVQNEYLSLSFDTVVYRGESLPIEAVALDPDTTLPGMATEVDRRYFRRVILPAAAAFVEGAASAISESGLTTVTVEGDTVVEEQEETSNEQEIASGIEEAGEELGELLDEVADNTETLVRIESGTPLGILFVEPVIQEINPERQERE